MAELFPDAEIRSGRLLLLPKVVMWPYAVSDASEWRHARRCLGERRDALSAQLARLESARSMPARPPNAQRRLPRNENGASKRMMTA